MSDTATSPSPHRPRRGVAAAWLLSSLVVLLAVGAWAAYRWNIAQAAHARAAESDRRHIDALGERMDALRRDQRAQTTRLQQAEATNRLLREELIGLGQRAALLEDSVRRQADSALRPVEALRLDEVELLLAQGQQRLLLSGDLDSARRAYALAAQLLEDVGGYEWLDLRQALAQERDALDALGQDPRTALATRLDALAAALPSLPVRPAPPEASQASWARVLSKLVEVRPSADAVAAAPADRAAGLAALQLEFGLARAAIERRDRDGYRGALARADAWLLRLWPDSADRRHQRARLQALAEATLALESPALGSTLAQLRRQRGAG